MNISEYLDEVRAVYATGQATEHSYRPAIRKLFAAIDDSLSIINEPKASDVGMPDFLFQRGAVPLGWAECKDIHKDIIRLKGYPKFDRGKVQINNDQYFADVPEMAWSFYIGGHQPAQKWLKDRRGRALTFEDTTHYQRIVKILVETDRIMKEIELPLE